MLTQLTNSKVLTASVKCTGYALLDFYLFKDPQNHLLGKKLNNLMNPKRMLRVIFS